MPSHEIDHVLEHLIRELLPGRGSAPLAHLDLVRAGLDPLGLVELVLRVEKTFGVELPDDVLNTDTPITAARFRAHLAAALPRGNTEHDHTAPLDETIR